MVSALALVLLFSVGDSLAARRAPASIRQSLFQAQGTRVGLQPQSMAQNFIEVRNESQLRAALGALPGAQRNCYGKGINIVADITLSEPLSLSAGLHDGLTISSPGRAIVNAGGFALTVPADDVLIRSLSIDDLGTFTISGSTIAVDGVSLTESDGIVISGTDVDLRDMTMSAGSAVAAISITGSGVDVDGLVITDGAATFSTIIALDNTGYNTFRGINSNNSAVTVFVTVDDPSNNIWIRDCMVGTATVAYDGTSWIVMGNEIGNIIGSAASGSSAIGGNFFPGGGTVNTSAGAGFNTIFGNVNITTLTPHGSDNTTGGNT